MATQFDNQNNYIANLKFQYTVIWLKRLFQTFIYRGSIKTIQVVKNYIAIDGQLKRLFRNVLVAG